MKLLLVIACVCCLGFSGQRDIDRSADFEWLEGAWLMQTKRGLVIESWKQSGDSSWNGRSKLVPESGDTLVLETMVISRYGGQYWYTPSVTNQNKGQPVRFRIVRFAQGEFVAENPAHDFPRRISYHRVLPDSLHAWIDDGKEPPEKKINFYYVRQEEQR